MTCCVIVPIYNAAPALRRCLTALSATLPCNARVVLADDASSDPAVAELCTAFAGKFHGRCDLLRHEINLGFIRNVNRAAQHCAEDDVLLLNSDTVPAPGWFEAMLACAASDQRIATVTPWSNNAEICSFPQFCRTNPLPDEADLARIGAALARGHEIDAPVELPTGVGFAMWISRRAWRELGDFDAATFGRGYGEENDFCWRARAHGWRNVHCAGAYVAHQGNVSFAQTAEAPGGVNLQRLVARYPDYNATIAAFIEADPLRAARARFAARLGNHATLSA